MKRNILKDLYFCKQRNTKVLTTLEKNKPKDRNGVVAKVINGMLGLIIFMLSYCDTLHTSLKIKEMLFLKSEQLKINFFFIFSFYMLIKYPVPAQILISSCTVIHWILEYIFSSAKISCTTWMSISQKKESGKNNLITSKLKK